MPNNNSKTYIVNDQPTEKDALDFTPYVETLADIIQTGNTPLTIGVFGTWGSGKTSLMKMVKKKLPDNFTTAWFDAWKYDKEETLWRAFLLTVLSALKNTATKLGKPTEEFEKMQILLYREMELEKVGGVVIDLPKLGGAFATSLVKLSLSFIPGISTLSKLVEELQKGAGKSATDDAVSAIHRERTKIYIEQIQFLEQFQNEFANIVKTYIAPKRLVVFVDDLDRCTPEKAIEVLEAIKLFLDAENCIFVLGLDQEVVARGIEIKYKELGAKKDMDDQQHFTIEGTRYLEKIIQLPFQIPPVEQSDMGDFVQELSAEWPHKECPKVFAEGLGDNPRQIKRTVNVFLMLWKLAEKRKVKLSDEIKPVRLAKVVAIQTIYPELYSLLKAEVRYLAELEKYYRGKSILPVPPDQQSILAVTDNSDEETTPIQDELPPALVPYISRQSIRRILLLHSEETPDSNFINLQPDEVRIYFTLTRSTEVHQGITFGTPLVFTEPQMIRIPTGNFLRGSSREEIAKFLEEGADIRTVEFETPQHTVKLSEYSIGKYLITNREYQVFVQDAKYSPPQSWDGNQFPIDKGDHPVINITWRDAVAYCDWLRLKTGRNYRLPTEAEWEKAARGTYGRIYPWGNLFDLQKCNVLESTINDTTPVGQYSPAGDSPYGCADMIGNVWEWCNDWFDANEYKNLAAVTKDPQGPTDGQNHVRKGGAYDSSYRKDVRCAYRNGFRATRLDGFRVALSLSILSSREKEILLLIEKGLSNKQIANSLSIDYQTVKNHVTSIFRKFNVTNRKQAVNYAYEKDIIQSTAK